MANIPMKSIQLPGLSDTYTFLQSGIVAEEYSALKTYAVGDYITKDGELYICKSAITTAEAWNALHWKKTTAAGEVSDLKSAFAKLGLAVIDGQFYIDPVTEIA